MIPRLIGAILAIIWGLLVIGYVESRFKDMPMSIKDVRAIGIIAGLILAIIEAVAFYDWSKFNEKVAYSLAIGLWIVTNLAIYAWYCCYEGRSFSNKRKFIWVVAIIIGLAIIEASLAISTM